MLHAGIPRNLVLLKPQMRGVPKQPMGASRAALAEYGTFTLEFMGLSHRTNNPEYGAKAEAIIKGLYKRNADRVSSGKCLMDQAGLDVIL